LKKKLRDELLKRREGIDPEEKKLKEAAIKKRLLALNEFKKSKSVLFYASFRSEVDTMSCINHALRQKKIVSLPLVDEKNKKLRLYKIKDTSELVPGYMGIPEPGVTKGREIDIEEVDLVIVPGAGFDTKGNRLGYGFGYYDKLLSNSKRHITTIALAFEEQIVPSVPNETHDIKIDKIITDKRVINCKTKDSRIQVKRVMSNV
jgi:5-formyltetrahydrofolate cyclo-ligase